MLPAVGLRVAGAGVARGRTVGDSAASARRERGVKAEQALERPVVLGGAPADRGGGGPPAGVGRHGGDRVDEPALGIRGVVRDDGQIGIGRAGENHAAEDLVVERHFEVGALRVGERHSAV